MSTGDLNRAYAECRKLHFRHGKTYFFSSLFFPPPVRRRVHGLYGFVRYCDDLVDNFTRVGDAAENLIAFRAATLDAIRTGSSSIPVLQAFADVVHLSSIPNEYPIAFLDSMAMDLTKSRYQTMSELMTYMYGSASVIGLMLCCVMNITDPKTRKYAEDLGIAMQLTNFLRDIGEDWRERRRIYIPQEDLDRFGYTEKMLEQQTINSEFRELMRFELARARTYYELADRGIPSIPVDCRLPVKLARVLYSRILEKIERNQYDIFTVRARTTTFEKVTAAIELCSRPKAKYNEEVTN